jgi:hypothetical protein
LIALAFYGPLHYLGPLAVAFLTGAESAAARRRMSRFLIVDCTVSMVVAFGVAVWLFADRLPIAMSVLLASMLVPYLHIALTRRRR